MIQDREHKQTIQRDETSNDQEGNSEEMLCKKAEEEIENDNIPVVETETTENSDTSPVGNDQQEIRNSDSNSVQSSDQNDVDKNNHDSADNDDLCAAKESQDDVMEDDIKEDIEINEESVVPFQFSDFAEEPNHPDSPNLSIGMFPGDI